MKISEGQGLYHYGSDGPDECQNARVCIIMVVMGLMTVSECQSVSLW